MAAEKRDNLITNHSETMLSVALLGVLVVLLIPLPPFLLDMLLALNLAVSVLLLLSTLNVRAPLEISVFPSLLLLMTLYRLSLNVATTRLILLDGDAGRIVSTFGNFVVGGNLIVGLVIFLILVIIQFIVITKGSSRVSEVAARFTLDALPGKQMAIDAEMNAGSISEEEARERRSQLTREAEFYGAMDGASKFVRGDAIAGLIVTAVNIVGGVLLGMTNGMAMSDALERYSILTVGDGLVSQIPALIIATTAGILVTKAATKSSLSGEIGEQMLANKRPLLLGGLIVASIAITPGLPKIPFLLIAGLLFWMHRRYAGEEQPSDEEEASAASAQVDRQEEQLNDFLQTDRAAVEIGARLIPLVEPRKGKGLAERISTLRRELSKKHGIWIPAIRVRDNIEMEPESYRVLIGGREVARGQLRAHAMLAVDPGDTTLSIAGEETTDPAFGLPAKWIEEADRQRAEMAGFTVVDAASVMMTHLGEVLRRHAHELLSREDLQRLLDKLRETAPTIANEVKPESVTIATLHQVLVSLLEERVPITDLAGIIECLANHTGGDSDPNSLTEKVRERLGRCLADTFRDENGRVQVVVLDPRLEARLRDSIRGESLALLPGQLEGLLTVLGDTWRKASADGHEIALLTDTTLRRPMRNAIVRALADLAVMAYAEIPNDMLIEPVRLLRLEDVYGELRADAATASSEPAQQATESRAAETPVAMAST